MKKIVLFTSLVLSFHSQASNEKRISNEEYVDSWSRTAMENMLSHKIPASITLAQGILESGSGNSDLARKANNHFGIKCHDWKGAKVYKDDDAKNECFRKYDNASLSFRDHSEFLTGRSRYAALFSLKADDYKGWAKGLKAAGYATNPKYPDLLIDLIERLNLDKYDELVLNSPNKGADLLVKNQGSKTDKVESKEDKKAIGTKTKEKVNKVFGATVEVNVGRRETSMHENKVKYVVAKKGDTYYKIAEEMQMTLAQIHKYNDVKKGNATLKAGDVVNIHPKRSKGKAENKSFSEDLTILEISQREGIKVESLMKLNTLSSPKDVVKRGQKVTLR